MKEMIWINYIVHYQLDWDFTHYVIKFLLGFGNFGSDATPVLWLSSEGDVSRAFNFTFCLSDNWKAEKIVQFI